MTGATRGPWTTLVRFHEALELARAADGTTAVRCARCDTTICDPDENYKAHAARRDRPLDELSGRAMPDGSPYRAVLREYACPGCGTLLAVDPWLAAIGGDADLWDIHVTVPA